MKLVMKLSSKMSGFVFLGSLLCFVFLLDVGFSGKGFYFDFDLHFLGSGLLQFSFVLDWVSLSFGGVVFLISGSVLFYSSYYMGSDPFLSRFSWLVLLFVFSMGLVIFVPNLMSILLGWDGLGLVSFCLVIYYQNYKSLSGGMLTVLMNRVGDVMILLSIGWLVCFGHWNFLFLGDHVSWMIGFCVVVAGMTKSAQLPFSSWLPAAMAAPTPVSALVHSSTLVTAGVFLLVRFHPILETFFWFKPFLIVVAMLTLFMAGLSANFETDLKKVIALSTLSQLGVMMSSLALGLWCLSLFHLYTHALFKALLFLCAGSLIHRSHHGQDLRFMGGFFVQMPFTVSCLFVASLALCGFPFLAGFYSKDLILEESLFGVGNVVILLLLFISTGLTASYSIRVLVGACWGSFCLFSLHDVGNETWQEVLPMFVLTLGAVFSGSMMSWCLFPSDLLLLSSEEKFLGLFVTLSGFVLGWWSFSVSEKGSELYKGFGLLSFYFILLMWFLFDLSTQKVLKVPLKSGSSYLYVVDRGWSEFLGPQGVYAALQKLAQGSYEWYYSNVLAFVSSAVVFCFLLVGLK